MTLMSFNSSRMDWIITDQLMIVSTSSPGSEESTMKVSGKRIGSLMKGKLQWASRTNNLANAFTASKSAASTRCMSNRITWSISQHQHQDTPSTKPTTASRGMSPRASTCDKRRKSCVRRGSKSKRLNKKVSSKKAPATSVPIRRKIQRLLILKQ